MLKSNLKRHELIGLIMIFLSGTLLGLGLYITFWGANRPLLFGNMDYLLKGKEFLLFPIFYGFSFVLFALGQIELKEAMPGRRR
jgi:hypothetical protein